ncbi:hypothetical protein SUGI_1016200 [Cryptomeria japonica]|uniref:protein neprosin n=1 Tax=Cryptomeria japonica TaxID=3369 RepID=UPI0024148BA3|nr:protein neprosin [Cryptomeria japonica]GLJ48128.1 hypothetical protein SUGI_1016200 [Cryptomeria japonica]
MLYICVLRLFLVTFLSIYAFSDDNMSVDEFLNYVNPPAIHRYQKEDGGIILCVRFQDQLTLRSQTSQNAHKVERRGFFKQNGGGGAGNVSHSCPPGTFSLREVKKEDVLRVGGVEKYIKKPSPETIDILAEYENTRSHEYAVVEFTFDTPVIGTSAYNSVWKPHVAEDAHYSLSQVWVTEENRLETIEAGWHVDPQRYGDDDPRFFVYWTADRYLNTGCYNTYCSGFVVANNFLINFGVPLKSTKLFDSSQYELPITIRLSEIDGEPAWLLEVYGTLVGYWPSSLFRFISQSSSLIIYGGEVSYSAKKKGESLSKTEMGSGRFPAEGWRSSAHIRQIQFFGTNSIKVDKYIMASNTNCYDIVVAQDYGFGGLYAFYGGPGGGSQNCRA